MIQNYLMKNSLKPAKTGSVALQGKRQSVMKWSGLLFEPDKASLPYLDEACSRPAEPKREQAAVPANQTSTNT